MQELAGFNRAAARVARCTLVMATTLKRFDQENRRAATARLTAQGPFRSPSHKGNGTVLLTRPEMLPTSRRAAKLADSRERLQHFA
jgi:hypothetical protein